MRRAVRHQGMIVQLHDAIHTNRATVKENRKNYSYPSVGLYFVYRLVTENVSEI
jgi:hypothetical protein